MDNLEIKRPQPKGRVVKCKACGRVYDLGELTKTRKFRNRCPYCETWQQHPDPREAARRQLEEREMRPISYEKDAFSESPARMDAYGLTNGDITRTTLLIERNLLDEIKRRAKTNSRTISDEIQRVLYVHYAEMIAKEQNYR